MIKRVLILCIGNICRSPMAEAVMRERLAGRDREIDVRSAGLGAMEGYPADESVQLLLQRRGMDISTHRAVQVSREMLRWADLILVMEDRQRLQLGQYDPSAIGKVLLLGHWIGEQVPDPYLAPLGVFEETLEIIDRAVGAWIERL